MNLILKPQDEMLQWGHDKIVMEVSIVTRWRKNKVALQWGHDKIVMEVNACSE